MKEIPNKEKVKFIRIFNKDYHIKMSRSDKALLDLAAGTKDEVLDRRAQSELDDLYYRSSHTTPGGELSCIGCGRSIPVAEMLGMKCVDCRIKTSEDSCPKMSAVDVVNAIAEFKTIVDKFKTLTKLPPEIFIESASKSTPENSYPKYKGTTGTGPGKCPKKSAEVINKSLDNLDETLCEFRRASRDLNTAMAIVDQYVNVNNIIQEDYPFKLSFDDEYIATDAWVDTILNKIRRR